MSNWRDPDWDMTEAEAKADALPPLTPVYYGRPCACTEDEMCHAHTVLAQMRAEREQRGQLPPADASAG